ncbi:MAG: TetR/AcrR family transcriptional regulator [Alphaproteobacteria bacterium]|nr:TetR/AcrR family transcriptional regulator [Alphaproteobacteria bacterium]
MSEAAVTPRGHAVAAEVNEMANEVRTDGRNRRAAATRAKIIEAAKAMITETSEAPTVVGVAKRADVSVRSVFQHFGDVQSLFVTVVDSIGESLEAARPHADAGAFEARVDALIQDFAQLFDKIVPLRVAAGQFVGHSALEERGQVLKQQLRDATVETFAPELAALEPAAREQLVDAIGAALSLDAWIVLRRRDGLSVEQAIAVWRLTLTALLRTAKV